jgi:hypothetical protein
MPRGLDFSEVMRQLQGVEDDGGGGSGKDVDVEAQAAAGVAGKGGAAGAAGAPGPTGAAEAERHGEREGTSERSGGGGAAATAAAATPAPPTLPASLFSSGRRHDGKSAWEQGMSLDNTFLASWFTVMLLPTNFFIISIGDQLEDMGDTDRSMTRSFSLVWVVSALISPLAGYSAAGAYTRPLFGICIERTRT